VNQRRNRQHRRRQGLRVVEAGRSCEENGDRTTLCYSHGYFVIHILAVNSFRIVSGGQTGVDRAALEFAVAHRIRHGGWCPRGRKAEDGMIPPRYRLRETGSASYDVRTRWNVRDSYATI